MTWQSLGNNTLLLEENRTIFYFTLIVRIVQHASVISVTCLYDTWKVLFGKLDLLMRCLFWSFLGEGVLSFLGGGSVFLFIYFLIISVIFLSGNKYLTACLFWFLLISFNIKLTWIVHNSYKFYRENCSFCISKQCKLKKSN